VIANDAEREQKLSKISTENMYVYKAFLDKVFYIILFLNIFRKSIRDVLWSVVAPQANVSETTPVYILKELTEFFKIILK
jgi:hypothetical protein